MYIMMVTSTDYKALYVGPRTYSKLNATVSTTASPPPHPSKMDPEG